MRMALGLALLLSVAAWGQHFNLTLTGPHGAQVSIPAGKGEVTVVLFISTICPVSNNYNTRMNDLYRDYSAKGVKFVFVNANQNESAAQVEEHARRAGFAFPVYRDVGNRTADRLGAQYTPETFVIGPDGAIRYHGRIDDAQNQARVQQNSLRLAIDAVLAGAEVATPETKAFGCTIKRTRRTS